MTIPRFSPDAAPAAVSAALKEAGCAVIEVSSMQYPTRNSNCGQADSPRMTRSLSRRSGTSTGILK